MSEIMISNDAIQYITMVSKILKIDVLDCMIKDEKLIFIVRKGQLGIAIGIKGKNLEKLRNLFNKNIKFVESDTDAMKFLTNLCKPYKINKISFEGDTNSTIAKIEVPPRDKSKLIGKGGRNIEIIRELAKRHHSIKDVQIL